MLESELPCRDILKALQAEPSAEDSVTLWQNSMNSPSAMSSRRKLRALKLLLPRSLGLGAQGLRLRQGAGLSRGA